MRFVKIKSTIYSKYGFHYERSLKTLVFMWGKHRFYILF
jgi:hypothetical protein